MSEESDESDEGATEEMHETQIEAEIGALRVSVQNHDPHVAEEQFRRTWDFVTEDAAEWSDALRERMTFFQ